MNVYENELNYYIIMKFKYSKKQKNYHNIKNINLKNYISFLMIDQLKNNEAENKAQTPLTSFLDEISTIHSKKRQINLNLEF